MQEEMSFIAQKVETTCVRGKKRKWLEIVWKSQKIKENEKEKESKKKPWNLNFCDVNKPTLPSSKWNYILKGSECEKTETTCRDICVYCFFSAKHQHANW